MCVFNAWKHVVWSQNLLWPDGEYGQSSVTHYQIHVQVKASLALFEAYAKEANANTADIADNLGLVRDTSERVLALIGRHLEGQTGL